MESKETKPKRQKTTKVKAQDTEQRHYYKMLVESATGKLVTRFLHACQKCELQADDWAKRFMATYRWDNPRCFAGGVACVSFDKEPDLRLWKPFAVINGEQTYLPAVETVVDLKTGKSIIQAIKDYEPHQKTRDIRRAMKAEEKRQRLPLVKTETLYEILKAQLPDNGKLSDWTPTIFEYDGKYFIGCEYVCEGPGMTEITQQTHRMYQSKLEIEIRKAEEERLKAEREARHQAPLLN